jgi:formylglycine-generating enzyme required for sulfatase activity
MPPKAIYEISAIDWIQISGGAVTLQPGGYLAEATLFAVAPFAMARYPVTNACYAGFVQAGGYENSAWWSAAGWAARVKEKWTEPRHWHSRDWNQPDCPVVGVSWYEAMAFCRWLSEARGERITLPTEQQWQRAAQGDDGRLYPWGNEEPAAQLCNWNRDVDETTRVGRYTAGAGPFGVMDLAGNVWEWCLTGWESGAIDPEGDELRVLRGGSWSSDSVLSLRVTNRSSRDPNTRLAPGYRHHVTVGFRCALEQLP